MNEKFKYGIFCAILFLLVIVLCFINAQVFKTYNQTNQIVPLEITNQTVEISPAEAEWMWKASNGILEEYANEWFISTFGEDGTFVYNDEVIDRYTWLLYTEDIRESIIKEIGQ